MRFSFCIWPVLIRIYLHFPMQMPVVIFCLHCCFHNEGEKARQIDPLRESDSVTIPVEQDKHPQTHEQALCLVSLLPPLLSSPEVCSEIVPPFIRTINRGGGDGRGVPFVLMCLFLLRFASFFRLTRRTHAPFSIHSTPIFHPAKENEGRQTEQTIHLHSLSCMITKCILLHPLPMSVNMPDTRHWLPLWCFCLFCCSLPTPPPSSFAFVGQFVCFLLFSSVYVCTRVCMCVCIYVAACLRCGLFSALPLLLPLFSFSPLSRVHADMDGCVCSSRFSSPSGIIWFCSVLLSVCGSFSLLSSPSLF
mmetsp:Transcript_1265/g.2614  ORF Transcript_1265/g.2614 Transcript_1265/m.2614 type:complete len:305 (+) Transcript_1265:566-1480(+)